MPPASFKDARGFAKAFGEIIQGTDDVSQAFADMATNILREVNRLLVQRLIVEPLIGAIFPGSAAAGPGASPATVPSASGFDASLGTAASIQVSPGSGGPAGFGVGATAAAPTVIVQQTVHFSPSFIDQRSGERFIQEHAGDIAKVIGDAARTSGAFAAALRR